jgi:energy-coupling factor transporter ATP-binding protein EcfA2
MAQGDRAVAIAGDAQAATITTGDGNVVLNVVFQADGLQIAGQAVQGQAVETLRQLLQGSLPAIEIDWQKVSRSLLNEQIQRLTTNPLTRPENVTFQTDQVYVPLGLVERKKVSRRGEDVSPEQGSLLYEETEIIRKFEHGDFLEQVLQRGQSPRSGGRRIAVIGEPGAGKTTLLQQMARWVAENIEGAIAIWVSLADLQGRSVEAYLLEQWLPAAVQQQGRAEASTQVKDAFVGLFGAGRVWLLLDGVDEMPVAAGSPLGEMDRQVRLGGLLAQARIVLTCRLNLWDGDRHALDSFDVYRTLEFAYPGQVEQFVGQWFGALPEVEVGQAEKLCEALRQPGKERLRDLVKNPLRLTLLCFNWYLGEGTLPETKAGLYEQFVADFYEWKRERFPTTAVQRGRLNAALGELAREAIDKEETRFRLRHDFVCEFLGEPDEPESLFQMALQLGWLNQIGVDLVNRKQAVYACFHPTFQEYFAAAAINNWTYFLPCEHKNKPVFGKTYRIFESRWKETVLLWLGQKKIDKHEKDEFIKALIEFEDGLECLKEEQGDGYEDFYGTQAYYLAAVALGEFRGCCQAEKIVAKILYWSFGGVDSNAQQWMRFIQPFRNKALDTLLEMERMEIIPALEKFIKDTPKNTIIRGKAVETLQRIDPSNINNFDSLVSILNRNKPASTPSKITLIIPTPLQKFSNDQERIVFYIRRFELHGIFATEELRKLCLENVCLFCDDPNIRIYAAEYLRLIDIGNNIATETLNDIGFCYHPCVPACITTISEKLGSTSAPREAKNDSMIESTNNSTRSQVLNLEYVEEVKNVIYLLLNELGFFSLSSVFLELDLNNSGAVNESVESILLYSRFNTLNNLDNIYIYKFCAELKTINFESKSYLLELEAALSKLALKISLDHNLHTTRVADSLRNLTRFSQEPSTREEAASILSKLDPLNPETIACLENAIENFDNKSVLSIIETLLAIDSGNKRAFNILRNLTRFSQEPSTREEAASILSKLDPLNPETITCLEDAIENFDNKSVLSIIETLLAIDSGNKRAFNVLHNLTRFSQEPSTRVATASILSKLDPLNPETIACLEDAVENFDNKSTWDIVDILFKLDQGNVRIIDFLITICGKTKDENKIFRALQKLRTHLPSNQMPKAVSFLKNCLLDDICEENIDLYESYYALTLYCVANMDYPEFYQAWHISSTAP